jgi:hypothetical protein
VKAAPQVEQWMCLCSGFLEAAAELSNSVVCHEFKHPLWTYFCVPLQWQGEMSGSRTSPSAVAPSVSKQKRQILSSISTSDRVVVAREGGRVSGN